jgi:sugar/nucleoside kinase (ribokinase family)
MGRPKAPRILVVGELNVDIIAVGLHSPPKLGTEVLASDCAVRLGSASAIFAVGLAKLGCPVTFVSHVGHDSFGEFCLRSLRSNGVSTENVQRKRNENTGVTISLSNERDRALVTYPGAIATFTANDFDAALLKRHQHLHLTSYYLQEALKPAFPAILSKAKANGLTTSFDPNSDPSATWSKSINKVLRNTDVLFVNQREASGLTHSTKTNDALKTLGQLVPCAVIKLGSKGAVAIQNGTLVKHGGFDINAVDTTGAGDSFDAGFIWAYLRGDSLHERLRVANACGALSALQVGGTSGQPTEAQLKAFLESHQ